MAEIKCKRCEKTFDSNELYFVHYKLAHSGKFVTPEIIVPSKPVAKANESKDQKSSRK